MGRVWAAKRGKLAVQCAITAVIIAVFCFVPVSLLVQNISFSAGAGQLSNPVTLAPPANDLYGPATVISSPQPSSACVDFEFLGLDPSTSLANFGIVVSGTPYGVPGALAEEGYTVPVLLISSNVGLSSIAIPFPLSTLQHYDRNSSCYGDTRDYVRGMYAFRTQQEIFMLGQPRAFPNDWYELNDTVTVDLCRTGLTPDECVPGGSQGGTGNATAPPRSLPATLIATTDDQDLQMNVSTGPAPPAQFQTLLRRSGWFVWYTYVIAAMPFILLIALFSAYAWRRKSRKTGKVIQYAPARAAPAVHEIAFGVAAALVAILPLRAVLIPSSLPSLTRLDIVFSMCAAFLVALSVSWVFVWKEETAEPTVCSGLAPVAGPERHHLDQMLASMPLSFHGCISPAVERTAGGALVRGGLSGRSRMTAAAPIAVATATTSKRAAELPPNQPSSHPPK